MVTSKQPKGGQGATGVRTRSGPVKIKSGPVKIKSGPVKIKSGPVKIKSGPVKIKSGPVKMLQGMGYTEYTENLRQSRVDGKVQ